MSQPSHSDALTRLDDYLRRQMPEAEVDAFEEELFASALAGEAPALTFRRDLSRAFREMKTLGTIELWLNRPQVEALLASGARVIQFDLTADTPTGPDLSGEFDVLLTKIHADLRGLEQVDVEVVSLDGQRVKVMPEIAFDPEDGAVYCCCEADLARAAASVKTLSRLWGTNRAGERTLITTVPNLNNASTTP
jgi:hypothetical protein